MDMPKKTKVKWGKGFDDFWSVMEEGRTAAVEAGAALFGTTEVVVQQDPNGTQGRILDRPTVVAHEFVIEATGKVE